MSFSSLYSKISKNNQSKAKVDQILGTSPSVSSSTAKKPDSNSLRSTANKSSSNLNPLNPPLNYLKSNASYVDDDPAVRRLKEARRLEREKLSASKPKKNHTNSRNNKPRSRNTTTITTPVQRKPNLNNIPIKQTPTKSRFKHNPFLKKQKPTSSSPPPVIPSRSNPSPSSTGPRLSFKQLMKQAESVKQITTSTPFTLKKKSENEPSKAFKTIQKSRQSLSNPQRSSNKIDRMNPIRPSKTQKPQPVQQLPKQKPSFAKPNVALLNKLKQKKTYQSTNSHSLKKPNVTNSKPDNDSYGIDANEDEFDEYDDNSYGYDYDSEDDGFIVDDDDDVSAQEAYANDIKRYNKMKSQGYSKNEIWEIFNRGKKRNYYDLDYDSADDMEATGSEILEDEERTLKQAKLDDLREQRLLDQKAAQKRKMLKKN